MLSLTPISFKQTRPLMRLVFDDDFEVNENTPNPLDDLQKLADRNFNDVRREFVLNKEIGGLQFWAVKLDNLPIGFTITAQQPFAMLCSFGINKKFRNMEVLTEWLGKVEGLFEDGIYCVPLWKENVRVIEFLKRNGFNVYTEEEGKIYLINSVILHQA